LINVAGGPAIDSLNTLILLCKNHPGILSQREIFLDILDLDDTGPAFTQAALAAFSAPGAPLCGTRVAFRAIHYDWSKTGALTQALYDARSREGLIVCSSEGGLFAYGSDGDVLANLTVLRAANEVVAVAGSALGPMNRFSACTKSALQEHGLVVSRPSGRWCERRDGTSPA